MYQTVSCQTYLNFIDIYVHVYVCMYLWLWHMDTPAHRDTLTCTQVATVVYATSVLSTLLLMLSFLYYKLHMKNVLAWTLESISLQVHKCRVFTISRCCPGPFWSGWTNVHLTAELACCHCSTPPQGLVFYSLILFYLSIWWVWNAILA